MGCHFMRKSSMQKPIKFPTRLSALRKAHQSLVARMNSVDKSWYNGVYKRYVNPVVTPAHVPLVK